MTSPIDQEFNNIVASADIAHRTYIDSDLNVMEDDHDDNIQIMPPTTQVENVLANEQQGNKGGIRIVSFESPTALTEGDTPLLANSRLGQDLLRMVLMTEHIRNNPGPPGPEEQQTNPSPTPTEDDTPGYPYQLFLGDEEDDIPTDIHSRPYLAAQINQANGDPQLVGTEGTNAPVYDEGPLNALPRPWIDEGDD